LQSSRAFNSAVFTSSGSRTSIARYVSNVEAVLCRVEYPRPTHVRHFMTIGRSEVGGGNFGRCNVITPQTIGNSSTVEHRNLTPRIYFDLRTVLSGTLRVGLPLAGVLMMPTLLAFLRAYPEIVLDLDFSDRVVDVIEEAFNAVVRFADVGDSRLMTRGFRHISPTPRSVPSVSSGQRCPPCPGRPKDSRLPAPQVSDQRKV
jgi:hypothetical protein